MNKTQALRLRVRDLLAFRGPMTNAQIRTELSVRPDEVWKALVHRWFDVLPEGPDARGQRYTVSASGLEAKAAV